jgi:hypothetical protein
LGRLAVDQQLIMETLIMEPGEDGEIAVPGVGVAEGVHGALEVGAGLGGMGLAAFGHGTCLLKE